MTAAMQAVPAAAIARTSTAMNIIRQGGASIGTAILSVILASEITSHLGAAGSGGLESIQSLSPAQQASASSELAASFASTFVWALVLLAIAFIPALYMALGKWKTADAGDAGHVPPNSYSEHYRPLISTTKHSLTIRIHTQDVQT